MRINTAIPVVAALAPVVLGMDVHVRAADDLIDVGDLDIFKHTWQAIYAAAGNKEGVTIRPAPIATQNKPCHFNGHTDHSVSVIVEGHWDDVGGRQHGYRDAMIEAAWESLKRISDRNSYSIWKDCCAETISTSCGNPGPKGCGATNSCHCPDGPNSRCRTLTKGHRVPAVMNVFTTKNGASTPNTLRVAFSSNTKESKGGCGTVETVAKGIASFIFPGPLANLVGTGIDLQCGL
ncbi:hypothetical protein F66182_7781 [Fusarium sp. NRRL 66182]|nr:hypothetical protein F66182_7781 [Fusarium sp. NRRL 66182]